MIQNCPGWKLKSNKVYHNIETKTLHYNHARIHIFNIPIFYSPYFTHPDPSVKKRTGFLMPTIASDNQLGDSVSLPFFYNMSSSHTHTTTQPNQTSTGYDDESCSMCPQPGAARCRVSTSDDFVKDIDFATGIGDKKVGLFITKTQIPKCTFEIKKFVY